MKNGHANLQAPVVEMNAIVLMRLTGYQQWNSIGLRNSSVHSCRHRMAC